jgi:UPF0716 protein FxsA
MGTLLLLLFIGMPIAEIYVFIEAGGRFGVWPTVAAVILTAVIGTALLRAQGLAVMQRARDSLDRGEMPLAEVFDGACLLLAGALLLTPGFITDAIGFALLIPLTRAGLKVWAAKHLVAHARVHTVHTGPGGPRRGAGPRGTPGGVVIDGDYEDVTEGEALSAEDGGDGNGDADEPPRLGR